MKSPRKVKSKSKKSKKDGSRVEYTSPAIRSARKELSNDNDSFCNIL